MRLTHFVSFKRGQKTIWPCLFLILWVGFQPSMAMPPLLSILDYQGVDEPSDWLSAPNAPLAAFPSPANGTIAATNPPHFSWAWPDPNVRELTFEIELLYPNHQIERMPMDRAGISFWPGPLSPNLIPYGWRVRALKKGGAVFQEWSHWRQFFITDQSTIIERVNTDSLYQKAIATPRPRTISDPSRLKKYYIGAGAPFQKEWATFIQQLAEHTQQQPLITDPQLRVQGGRNLVRVVNEEVDLTMNTALAWLVTGETRYREAAVNRSLNLARWQAANQFPCDWNTGILCRRVNLTLAFLYDWLYPHFNDIQRKTIRTTIVNRLGFRNGMQFFTTSLFQSPLDSWGNATHNQLAMISALMAGEEEIFQSLFKQHIPLLIHHPNLWGADDGVFGNGMGYAALSLRETLMAVWVIKATTGYDLGQHPYLKHHPYFWLYFQPPVLPERIYSPTFHTPGAFGDEAENFLMSAYVRPGIKALVSYLNQDAPILAYDASLDRVKSQGPDWLGMLNPVDTSHIKTKKDLSLYDSVLFPIAGWVAMHSDLVDPERVSVYFKSSRYGSLNHNHADQNSFVIHAGGIPLFIDSGFYDSYDSTHHKNWYQQTKAHNAITFDDGSGQGTQCRSMSGFISRYRHYPKLGLTTVTGNATRAYGEALTQAKRSLFFIKPNTLIVYDELSSLIPRKWEWNFHAAENIEVLSASEVRLSNLGKTACMTLYSTNPVQFSQTDLFGLDNRDAPTSTTTRQYHGRFLISSPTEKTKFLAVIRVGCHLNTIDIQKVGSDIQLRHSQTSIKLPGAAELVIDAKPAQLQFELN